MGWCITCPVLLVHLSNLAGEDTYNVGRAMRLIIELNLMVLLGATASFATGWDSVAYYVASFIVCLVLFVQVEAASVHSRVPVVQIKAFNRPFVSRVIIANQLKKNTARFHESPVKASTQKGE